MTADGTPEEVAANAAFIVRACNAHDELATALREVVNATACLIADKRTLAEQTCLEAARAALAKVAS
jgi:hypothetical protein